LMQIKDNKQRVKEAMKLSKFDGRGKKEDILQLKFPDYLGTAIDRMKKFVPDIRLRAKLMIENIINEYEKIIAQGIALFQNSSGDVNYSNYVTTTSKIVETLPDLIAKFEEGYGVVYSSSEEELELKETFSKNWYYQLDSSDNNEQEET